MNSILQIQTSLEKFIKFMRSLYVQNAVHNTSCCCCRAHVCTCVIRQYIELFDVNKQQIFMRSTFFKLGDDR